MFSNEDLKCLDPKYFSIITTDAYDVTIMSRNTGHYWYLHNPEYPEQGTVIIFHKHKASHPYHQHGRANTLRQAVRSVNFLYFLTLKLKIAVIPLRNLPFRRGILLFLHKTLDLLQSPEAVPFAAIPSAF